MQTKHLCVLIHIWTQGEVGEPWKWLKPSSKIFLLTVLFWIIYVISVLFLLYIHARLFIDALWSPAGKGLASLLSFVMLNCDVVTFSLVSWVRCGAWLYRFLIFALFLSLNMGRQRFWYESWPSVKEPKSLPHAQLQPVTAASPLSHPQQRTCHQCSRKYQ